MATINGTWVFNLVLSKPNFEFYQSGVNFGIDGLSEPVAAIIYYLETNGAYTGNRLWYRGGVDGFPDGDINMVYNFDTNTWTDTKFRTISFSGDEVLVEEFAAWFTANATKQVEEATYTLSGKWIFNETLNGIVGDIPLWPTQNVNEISFISSPNRFGDKNYIAFVFHQVVTANESLVLAYRYPYENENGFALEDVYIYEPVLDDQTIGWVDKSYRIVNFGTTSQTVSNAFYEWFTSNANPYVEHKIATFDLSTLNIEIGTHTVTAKSKKKYYNDSENSNSVIYDK